MSDLFGNHIVGFPTRWLMFSTPVQAGPDFRSTIGKILNPYLTNGFSHHYHLGESTFIFRGVRSDF